MQPHSVFLVVKLPLLYQEASICPTKWQRGEDSIYILPIPSATSRKTNVRRPQLGNTWQLWPQLPAHNTHTNSHTSKDHNLQVPKAHLMHGIVFAHTPFSALPLTHLYKQCLKHTHTHTVEESRSGGLY